MFSGIAAQLTATNGPALRAREAVDEARQHFLAGAGFADDQHRAFACGDASRELQQALRAGRTGDRLRRPARWRSRWRVADRCSPRIISTPDARSAWQGRTVQEACPAVKCHQSVMAVTGAAGACRPERQSSVSGSRQSAAATMPSLRSFSTSVVRRSPSSRAACATVPLERSSACSIRRRSMPSRCARRSMPPPAGRLRQRLRGGRRRRQQRRSLGGPLGSPARAARRTRAWRSLARPSWNSCDNGRCDAGHRPAAAARQRARPVWPADSAAGRSRDFDDPTGTHDRQAFDEIGQLADVAGPAVRAGRPATRRTTAPAAALGEVVGDELARPAAADPRCACAAPASRWGIRSGGDRDPRGTWPRPIDSSRLRWVAAMMRTLQRICTWLPTRSKTRSCSTRSSFTCMRRAHVTDLVEEQRAALGDLEAALACGDRAGEGAFLVAEQLGLEQLGGNGTAIEGHKRAAAARAQIVDGAGRDFFAGARLAEYQHGGIVGRDLADQCGDVADGLRVAARHARRAFVGRAGRRRRSTGVATRE